MRYWLVMPAAGSGSRFGAGGPKQYAPLAGRPDRKSVGEGKRVEFGGCPIIKKKKTKTGEELLERGQSPLYNRTMCQGACGHTGLRGHLEWLWEHVLSLLRLPWWQVVGMTVQHD